MTILPFSMWRMHRHGCGFCFSAWQDASGCRHWVRVGLPG